MPHKINIFDVGILKYFDYNFEIKDDIEGGYLAFAYPGAFIGYGETREEAMAMAKLRYRKEKQKFMESHESAEEIDWFKTASIREARIKEAHKRFGIGKDQIWSEDNTDIGRSRE